MNCLYFICDWCMGHPPKQQSKTVIPKDMESNIKSIALLPTISVPKPSKFFGGRRQHLRPTWHGVLKSCGHRKHNPHLLMGWPWGYACVLCWQSPWLQPLETKCHRHRGRMASHLPRRRWKSAFLRPIRKDASRALMFVLDACRCSLAFQSLELRSQLSSWLFSIKRTRHHQISGWFTSNIAFQSGFHFWWPWLRSLQRVKSNFVKFPTVWVLIINNPNNFRRAFFHPHSWFGPLELPASSCRRSAGPTRSITGLDASMPPAEAKKSDGQSTSSGRVSCQNPKIVGTQFKNRVLVTTQIGVIIIVVVVIFVVVVVVVVLVLVGFVVVLVVVDMSWVSQTSFFSTYRSILPKKFPENTSSYNTSIHLGDQPLSSTCTKVIISRSAPLPRTLRALVGPTDTEGVRFPFSGPLG